MKYAILIIFVSLLLSACSFMPKSAPEEPDSIDVVESYYQTVQGLTGEELKAGLHHLIRDHRHYPYFSDDIGVGEMMMDIERDPDNSQNIILFYTGRSQNMQYADHGDDFDYSTEYGIPYDDTWNREHIWAKSHGFPAMSDTAYSDIHHLRPVDRSTNGAKGAKDFDWGGYPHEEAKGSFTDFDSWEPRDAVKGDVARMIFYMAVRYENAPDLEILDETGTSGPHYGRLSSLLEWNTLDPVDDRERARNNAIFEKYQLNRNPFVDHPEYATMIWGEPSDEQRIMPAATYLRFGDVAIDGTPNDILYVISGRNLTEPVIVEAPEGFLMAPALDGSFETRITMYPVDGGLNRALYLRFMPLEKRVYQDSLRIRQGERMLSALPMFGRGIDPGTVTILEQGFNDREHGWERKSIASRNDWHLSSYDDRTFMKISGYKADEPSDDWLISPLLKLANYRDVVLQFETAKNHSDIMDGLEVMISAEYISGEDIESVQWYHLPAEISQGKYEWVHSGYLNLDRYREKNVHIAFRYRCSSTRKATSWELDDVKITGIPVQ